MKHVCKFVPFHAAFSRARFFPGCVLAASAALFAPPLFAAQTPKPSPAVAQKSTPQTPKPPTAPANQPPVAAKVSFQNGKLTIHARNSELLQILEVTSAKTGMKVVGIPGQHRVFGTYGPGKPRAVLTQLLAGFDFNYLLVGASQNGAPRNLILAGMAATGPEPHQPVHSVQPAPQNPDERLQYHPTPFYQPKRPKSAPKAHPHSRPSPRDQAQRGGRGDARSQTGGRPAPRTPQEILKQLEAMRARQQQHNSQ